MSIVKKVKDLELPFGKHVVIGSGIIDIGGEIYHVINRANARLQIFDTEKDYRLFEQVIKEAKERTDVKNIFVKKT